MTGPARRAFLAAKARWSWALVRKESRQVVRDPSSIAIGFVLPLILILLFGFALSLDVKHAPVALVIDQSSAEAQEVAASFALSPYFDTRPVASMEEAKALMLAHQVDGIVRLQADFARRRAAGDAEVQVLLQGVDANRARIIEVYAEAAVAQADARRAAEGQGAGAPDVPGAGQAVVQTRLWFNSANDSRYFLVPGLIVLIVTLIGAFMTSMVVAREWERGTFEALFVTPVRSDEILIGKIAPYFLIGMGGLMLCVGSAQFLFHVPIRGSLFALTLASLLYLLVAVAIGILISSSLKSQFLASQIVLVVTFMPALMLSGFIYDLRNVPLVIRLVSFIVPARYYVSLLQTIFLAGDVWRVILPNAAVLAAVAVALLFFASRSTRKTLGLNGAMLASLRRILALIRKELLAVLKDARTRNMLLIQPVLQNLLFGYAATLDLNNVLYAAYDQDRSAASSALLARLDGSGVFHRVANITDAADIGRLIDSQRVLMVIQIGPDFERRLTQGVAAGVQVIADGRNSSTAGTALGYVDTAVAAFNADRLADRGLPGPAVRPTMRSWYNPNLETRWNMVPALVGTITFMSTMMLAALSVAREREEGTFDQLLVAPFHPVEIMAGKAIPAMLIGLVQATNALLVAQLWFHIPFAGSFVTLYAGLTLFLLAAVGLGLVISSVAGTMQQAMLYAFVVINPFALLSGLTTPISSMPRLIQDLTLANPLRYAIEVSHRVYLEGADLRRLWPDLWPMAIIATVTLSAAAWMFRNRLE